MADISWIKLATDIPDHRKIKRIRKLPDGNNIILFWVFLLARAGESNHSGGLYMTDTLPYSVEDLSADFDFTTEFVEFALITLEKYGMITRYDEIIFIKNWEEYQAVEGLEKVREQNRIRQAKYRDKQKQLTLGNVTGNVEVTANNGTDIELDKELDIDKEKDNKDSRKPRKRVYEDDSPYIQLSKFLYEKINADAADKSEMTKEPNYQNWADDIRKMIDIDKRTDEQVRKMIEWCQSDSFWSGNILSAKKLRDKYDTMAKQANRQYQRKSVRQETMPDWVDNPTPEAKLSPEEQAALDAQIAAWEASKK
ncbi:hypothetical protein IGJ55_002113 [Enterococcus sp. AZ170]|uniref:phage replisome organizer N-terminal domain-containing protein n=1 Tax=Enterococcus sp. AZ170 TaxID=2774747 RepID=UPI003D2FA24F